MKSSAFMTRLGAGGFTTALVLFFAVLAVIFHDVFQPGQTLFSNDGPLGQLMAQCHRLPERFAGCWLDLNNIGFNGGAATPSISFALQWLLGPVLFSKFYAILSLLILGLGAWSFFRQLNLSPHACLLGGLAAILNSTFFSVACWGMGAHEITAGMCFLALAALADTSSRQRWLRVALAGAALGMAVTEGADVGAIFSVYAAAFVLYQTWTIEGSHVKNFALGMGRLTLVAGCAALLAVQSIHGLINSSIKGVRGTAQDAQTKLERWDWATQWSLPKVEALNLVVPGLFGFRMDTGDGGNYWGRMGRAPQWDRYLANGRQGSQPTGFLRYGGGGNYSGILVVLVALWAGAQSLRREKSIFSPPQRKWIWFWLAAAVVSLLLAFGRFAPFYQLVYVLPYFSTIRNPLKFLYLLQFALVVLFAFGVDGLSRQYFRLAAAGRSSWWSRATRFEKNWLYACGLVWLAGLLGWWEYSQHREELMGYLQTASIDASPEEVANFSIHQAGWFVAAFFLAIFLLLIIFSGVFAGRRSVWGGVWLAALLLADLGLANQPWIIYWNCSERYASNPIIETVRDQPYEHRVALAPLNYSRTAEYFPRLYRLDWLQQLFPYYNIQAFETVEMPRMPEDYAAYSEAINGTNPSTPWFNVYRAWQLTNTRYVLGAASTASYLSDQSCFTQGTLRLMKRFEIVAKPGVYEISAPHQATAVLNDTGRFGLFEFRDALPRVKLYSRWQVNTNDRAALKQLFDPSFDPTKTVLVADELPPDSATETASVPPGTVEFESYAPRKILLKAENSTPAVLLLNDHFDPVWSVSVDGQRAKLLRCNFIMRGVQLPSGTHQVEFKFQPQMNWFYVSLTTVFATILAGVWLAISARKNLALNPAPLAPVAVLPIRTKTKRMADSRKAIGNRAAKR